jgi:hypothetical protein
VKSREGGSCGPQPALLSQLLFGWLALCLYMQCGGARCVEPLQVTPDTLCAQVEVAHVAGAHIVGALVVGPHVAHACGEAAAGAVGAAGGFSG